MTVGPMSLAPWVLAGSPTLLVVVAFQLREQRRLYLPAG
jgi:hypothetical protein